MVKGTFVFWFALSKELSSDNSLLYQTDQTVHRTRNLILEYHNRNSTTNLVYAANPHFAMRTEF